MTSVVIRSRIRITTPLIPTYDAIHGESSAERPVPSGQLSLPLRGGTLEVDAVGDDRGLGELVRVEDRVGGAICVIEPDILL